MSRMKPKPPHETGKTPEGEPGPADRPRLRKLAANAVLGGVCSGLAESTTVPRWGWRLIFLTGALFFGLGALVYTILWFMLPRDPAPRPVVQPLLLVLFDAPDPQPDLNDKVANFLDTRLTEMKKQSRPARDLVVYYVGHGGFSSDSKYFLAIRDTRETHKFWSSYPIKALADTLKEHARSLRRYLILDSCFGAAAYQDFQSPLVEVACQNTLEEFPKKGTALLCASGPREPARILPSQEYTMFSDALVSVLRRGSPEEPDKLSFATLGQLTWEEIKERNLSEAVRPEVHSPEMREGDVAILPMFPNLAFRPQKARLFVDTVPPEAMVRILNLEVDFSQGMEINPGSCHVEVSAEGYETQKEWIELEAGKDKRLRFELKPMKSRLNVETVPQNAQVRILNLEAKFFQGMEIEPGTYHVEVSAEGYETKIGEVNIKAEKISV